MVTTETKANLVEKFGKNGKDTGSAEVQVAILTERIKTLTPHLASNKQDVHSKVGLMKIIGKRRRLLKYIKNKDEAGYQKLIKELGIRK
jgi:small subunit ribosomal protein S15